MSSITIRNVPDEVRNELAARAGRSGRSLQEFMLAEVNRLAERPSVETLIAEVRDRKRLTGTQIDRDELLEDLDADRR